MRPLRGGFLSGQQMANQDKGEVSIEIEGKSYTLSMDLDAMAALEEMFSKPNELATFDAICALADRGSMTHLRALIWCVLHSHHPELDIKDVGKLVQKAGGVAKFTLKLAQLAEATAPDARDLKALGMSEKDTPQKAQARRGTGARSISTRVGSA